MESEGLGDLLRTLADNVYHQPPTGHMIEYPCIVYELDSDDVVHADNKVYRRVKRWSVTVIHQDPDDSLPDKVAMLPLCKMDRRFTSDNLYHDLFTLFY